MIIELLILVLVMVIITYIVRQLAPDLSNIVLAVFAIIFIIWLLRAFGMLRF